MLGRTGKVVATLIAAALAAASLSASASAGTLYTTNYNDKTLAAFSIGSDGLLAQLSGSPYPLASYVYGLGITPNGRVLISASGFDSYLETFSLGASGIPSPVIAESAPAGGLPAITPDGRFMYLEVGPKGTARYSVGADGTLTSLGPPVGNAAGPVAITPNGRFLFQADYFTGNFERFAIGADGSLTPLGSASFGLERGPDQVRITPDGKFAVLEGRTGPSEENQLRTLAIGGDGSLTPTGTVVHPVDNTTRMLVVSPDGRFAFTTSSNEASVSTYSIDSAGNLTLVGTPAAAGLSGPQALAMSVDGHFLYVEPQNGGKVQAFSVAADGTLSKIGEPASTGGTSDGETPLARPSDPVASFVAKPGPPHGATSFDAGASTDSTAKIVAYKWDFGDGATLKTSTPTTMHHYKAAGVYTAHLSVVDDNGCSGYSYTGQTAYCGGKDASATVDTLPAIFGIAATPAKFATTPGAPARKGKKRRKPGTTLHYRLSENARVAFTVQRKLPGRRVGKACKKATKGNAKKPRCGRLGKALVTFKAKGNAGKNAKRFSGRTRRGPLKPGAYKITAVATDSAGGSSAPRSTTVKVKKP